MYDASIPKKGILAFGNFDILPSGLHSVHASFRVSSACTQLRHMSYSPIQGVYRELHEDTGFIVRLMETQMEKVSRTLDGNSANMGWGVFGLGIVGAWTSAHIMLRSFEVCSTTYLGPRSSKSFELLHCLGKSVRICPINPLGKDEGGNGKAKQTFPACTYMASSTSYHGGGEHANPGIPKPHTLHKP